MRTEPIPTGITVMPATVSARSQSNMPSSPTRAHRARGNLYSSTMYFEKNFQISSFIMAIFPKPCCPPTIS